MERLWIIAGVVMFGISIIGNGVRLVTTYGVAWGFDRYGIPRSLPEPNPAEEWFYICAWSFIALCWCYIGFLRWTYRWRVERMARRIFEERSKGI